MPNILKFAANFYIEIVLLIISSYCLYRLLVPKYKKKLPPGPIGLPFVGYYPFLGKEPHETIAKLREKYGDIIRIKLGSKYTIFLNEYNVMKEILCHPATMDKAAEVFHGIPIGFGAADGAEWQEQRKFCLRAMKNLGLGKGPWEKLTRESTSHFIEQIRSYKGQAVDILQLTLDSLSVNIMSLLVGRRLHFTSDKEIIKAATAFPEALTHFGASVAGSLIPGFRKFCIFFRLLGYDKAAQKVAMFFDVTRKEVEEHLLQTRGTDEDFINIYRQKMEDMKNEGTHHFFSEENLLGNISVLFVGAGESVANSLQSLIRLMAKYPEVQKKVQDELDDAIGRDGTISYEERHKVPYTFAVMQEAQRYSTTFPLTSSRKVIYDFEIGDYTIPKGSIITANMWAVNNDPNVYKNHEEFLPERFLSKDITKLIAFSFGKRNCPGETIAWMVIMTFFSVLMQNFTISVPPEVELNFDKEGGTSGRYRSQLLHFKERR